MLKKGFVFFVLFAFMIVIMGCETAKGIAKDTQNTWRNLSKADGWMKKNAW